MPRKIMPRKKINKIKGCIIVSKYGIYLLLKPRLPGSFSYVKSFFYEKKMYRSHNNQFRFNNKIYLTFDDIRNITQNKFCVLDVGRR